MSNYYYRKNKWIIGKKPIILIDFGTWELTLREAIFAFLIVGILTTIGYFFSSSIERNVHNKQLMYRQAAQIDKNEDEFKWALDTDIGYAFVEGHLETLDPVEHEHLNGKWLQINATFQKYQMHTRIVTYTTTDGKGHVRTHHRIETYWSWDTYDREKTSAQKVKFLGVELPLSKFDLSAVHRQEEIVKIGFHKRIVFNMIPTEMDGTIFTELKDKSISDNTEFLQNKDLKTAYEDQTTSHAIGIFWMIWIAVTIGCVFLFFYGENNWLED